MTTPTNRPEPTAEQAAEYTVTGGAIYSGGHCIAVFFAREGADVAHERAVLAAAHLTPATPAAGDADYERGWNEAMACVMARVRWMRNTGETDLRGLIYGVLTAKPGTDPAEYIGDDSEGEDEP